MSESTPESSRPTPTSANASGRAIVRNVAVNYLNLARATVIGLVVTPLLFHALGEKTFGIWSLLLGVTGYIGLVEGGISTALVARVAAAEARGDFVEVADALESGRILLSCLACFGGVLLLGATLAFNHLFQVPNHLAFSAQLALLFLGISSLVTIVGTSWTAALVGIGRVDLSSTVGFITTTALAIAQVVLAVCGFGLEMLAVPSAVIAVATVVINRRLVRSKLKDLPRGRASRRTALSLASLGSRNLLATMATLLAFGSDVVIVGFIAGPVAAAAYAVASRAANFARSVASSASNVLAPTFGHAAATDDKDRLRRLFRTAVLVSLLVAVPLALAISIFAGPLLEFWVGSPPRGSAEILIALVTLLVIQMPGGMAFVYFMGAQKSSVLLRFSLPSAVLNVVASVALTEWLGPVGPALGSLIATAIVDPLMLRHVAHKVLDMHTRELLMPSVAALAIPTLATTLLGLLAASLAAAHPAASAPLAGGTAALFVALALFWLKATRQGAELALAVHGIPRVGASLARLLGNVPST